MKEFELSLNSIDEMLEFGNKFLIIWCYIFNDDKQKDSDLLQCVRSSDSGAMPSCLLLINVHTNPWVGTDVAYPQQMPVLEGYSCGAGWCRIHSCEEFDNGHQSLLNMARQLEKVWLSNRSE